MSLLVISDPDGAYLPYVAKLAEPPYSRSPRWIPRPFGTSQLRRGDRVRVWDEAVMGCAGCVMELRQSEALVELDGGVREWIRAAVIELLDESVLRDR